MDDEQRDNANGQLIIGSNSAVAALHAERFTPAQLELIKRTVCKGATDDEFRLFMEVCKLRGLNPMARQIYAIRRRQWNPKTRQYEEMMTHQTSIDGFRLNAERSRKYAGQLGPLFTDDGDTWTDAWIKNTPPKAAKVGVLRHDFKEPLWAFARFDAYCPRNDKNEPTGLWKSMPDGQIAKCAEALALRRAFPEELSGLYVAEEMAQAARSEVQVQEIADSSDRTEIMKPESQPAPKAAEAAKPRRAAKVEVVRDEPKQPAPREPGDESGGNSRGATPEGLSVGNMNMLLWAFRNAGLTTKEGSARAAIEWLANYLRQEIVYDDAKSETANLRDLLQRLDVSQVAPITAALKNVKQQEPETDA